VHLLGVGGNAQRQLQVGGGELERLLGTGGGDADAAGDLHAGAGGGGAADHGEALGEDVLTAGDTHEEVEIVMRFVVVVGAVDGGENAARLHGADV